MVWTFLAFIFSLVFAYYSKGLLVFLLYTLIWEIIVFLLTSIPLRKRVKIIIASIIGYLLGSLIFYSTIHLQEPEERNEIGKLIDKNITNVFPSLHAIRHPFN